MTSSPTTNTPSPSLRATLTNSSPVLRLATLDDSDAITELIRVSAHGLSTSDYTPAQVEAALQGTFGVDSQLIRDQTYWLIESASGVVAAGGWSFRATLFGGDAHAGRKADALDPEIDAARIRAFFVHPSAARQGLAKRLLRICEDAAAQHGFRRFTLLATLPGVRLYQACGYDAEKPVVHQLADGATMTLVPMHKTLSTSASA